MSHQLHRVTTGRITHSKFFYTHSKHVIKSQVCHSQIMTFYWPNWTGAQQEKVNIETYHGQWWSMRMTHWRHRRQWWALLGRLRLQVLQNVQSVVSAQAQWTVPANFLTIARADKCMNLGGYVTGKQWSKLVMVKQNCDSSLYQDWIQNQRPSMSEQMNKMQLCTHAQWQTFSTHTCMYTDTPWANVTKRRDHAR